MPDMNYVVVTAADCPVEKRAMAVEKMSGFADGKNPVSGRTVRLKTSME